MSKQDLTGVTGSPVKRGFTLSHAVANANEIAVYVNNVRQEPTDAYTVNGTGLTMTGDVETTDDFYVTFLGKALQTIVPPDGSVSTAKLANSAVTSAKLASGITKNAIIDSYTPSSLTGLSSGQTVTLTGNYMDSGATVKLRKVSDSSDVSTTYTHSNDQSTTIATTGTFAAVTTPYKIVFQNPNGNEFIHGTNIDIGAPDIVLYNSDDHGGSGDVSSVTGGWTASSYNHNSSGQADYDADRMRTRISGTGSTGYGVGYALRSTNKVAIPTGYNRLDIIYRSVTGYNRFYLSKTSLQMGQNSPDSGGYTAGLTSNNPSQGTLTITLSNSVADGTEYYFYFAAYGGQNANLDAEITKVRVYAV